MLILNPSRLVATTITTITAMSTHYGLQNHHHPHPCSDHTIRLNHECPLRQSSAASLSSMKRKRTFTSSSLSMSCVPDAASSGTKILSKVVSVAAIMARGGAGALASSSTAGGESGRIFGFFGGGPRRKMIAEVFSFVSSGSAADAMLDLTRVQMRLEGLQVYATLAALLTNACLELYVNVKEPEEETYDDHDDRDEDGKEVADDEKEKRKGVRQRRQQIRNWAVDAFYLCTVVSILSGSYTTVVFGLFSILSKTALGRGLDASFIEFWGESAGIRNSGFESFLVALVSFEVAFLLSLFTKFSVKNPRKRRRQNILVGIGTVILLTSMRRWIKLLYLASKLLFPLWAEVQY